MKSNLSRAQNGPFVQMTFFFEKTIKLILMYLLAPFIIQNF